MYYRRDIMYSSERMVQPNSLLSKWRFRARNAVHGWPGLLSLLSGRRIDAVVPERTPLRAKIAAPLTIQILRCNIVRILNFELTWITWIIWII